MSIFQGTTTVKPVYNGHSQKDKKCYKDQLSLNAGQKYWRMLQVEHSAILSTFINLPFIIKIFVLSIFEWPFYTDFTVCSIKDYQENMKYLKVYIVQVYCVRLANFGHIGFISDPLINSEKQLKDI